MPDSLRPAAPPPPLSSRAAKRLAAEYVQLHDQRKLLSRQAADLGRRQNQIERDLILFVDHNKEDARRMVHLGPKTKPGGYQLEVHSKQKSPPWKQEFVRALGEARAQEIAASQPIVDKLSVLAT